jgi:branched-subunit amino acid transport protein AzlD
MGGSDAISALMAVVFIAGLAVVAFFVYFLPYDIAKKNQHPQQRAIFTLNLFLGWSLLGWVAALVWNKAKLTILKPATAITFDALLQWLKQQALDSVGLS